MKGLKQKTKTMIGTGLANLDTLIEGETKGLEVEEETEAGHKSEVNSAIMVG